MLTIRNPIFTLHCDPRLEAQANWVANFLLSLQSRPPGLSEGVTIRVGWSVLKLIRIGTELVLHEPDFSTRPLQGYRPEVSTTLTVLAMQTGLAQKLSCNVSDVRFDDRIVVQRGCLSHERIFAERQEPSPGDSGWYIGSAEIRDGNAPAPPAPSELESLRVYELLELRPLVLAALVLPVGWLVRWRGSEIDGISDHENRSVPVPVD